MSAASGKMSKKKRKKYPRLPSGFGSIRYLGEGRRNCYSVTLPATIDEAGKVERPTPLCYVDDWYKGFAVLVAYKAGTWTPGMEKDLEIRKTKRSGTQLNLRKQKPEPQNPEEQAAGSQNSEKQKPEEQAAGSQRPEKQKPEAPEPEPECQNPSGKASSGAACRDTREIDILVERILADYTSIKRVAKTGSPEVHELTFREVYEKFFWWKYERPEAKKFSTQSKRGMRAAYRNCEPLWNRPFCAIKAPELQAHLDSISLKHASLELVLSLYHQMYKYAIMAEICGEDKSKYVIIGKPDDDKHGEPLSEEELRTLWLHQEDEMVQMILIMCYSGFRIMEYKTMNEVNLEGRYFRGGMKTASGIGRYVPIHSAIYEFVSARIEKYGCLIPERVDAFRHKNFMPTLTGLGIPGHTPHDCRHTFSALCEKYGVRENDRKRMLGHAFSDITNAVYGHRTIEELREEIEKIRIPEM